MDHQGKAPRVGPGSVDAKRKVISFIKSLDLRNLTIDEIKMHVWHLLADLVMRTPEAAVGESIFRARVFPTKTPPEFFSDIGLPPASVITRNQRCNRAGQHIFYCTTSRAAALWENHIIPGDYAAISMWRLTKPCRLNLVGYSEDTFWKLGANRDMPNVSFPDETDANKVAQPRIVCGITLHQRLHLGIRLSRASRR
jgi:hypothetical protein